jgi:hypothetical protein
MLNPKSPCLVLILILNAACTARPIEPTVTFSGNQCAYAGPDRVPMRFTIRWTVENPIPLGSILQLVTLDPGKMLQDLEALPAEHVPPDWVHKLSYDFAFSPGSRSYDVNLSWNADYGGEPIYIVCFHGDKEVPLGAIGPLKVTP